ncbi:MAG: SGNH/GDSL hydrolase family protein, partial [bacterium]
MNLFFAHMASGNSLYSGVLLVLAGMGLELWGRDSRSLRMASRVIVVIGVAAIVASSVPQPIWLLMTWLLSLLLWRLSFNSSLGRDTTTVNTTRIVFLVITVIVLSLEIPSVYDPPPLSSKPDNMVIIGDSLTAGTARLDPEDRWPKRYESRYGVSVRTVAGPGWRISDAAEWISKHPLPEGVDFVVIVLGGNDVLKETPTEKYRKGLDLLLSRVKRRDVPTYMMELPLSPLANRYGRIQRNLA